MTAAPKRRWFRFSLRTLFVVMTVFGCWLGSNLHWIQERHAALDWIKTQAGAWHDVPVSQGAKGETRAPWQTRIFGDTGVEQIVVVVEKDAVVAKQRELARLFPEADVLVVTPGPGYWADKLLPIFDLDPAKPSRGAGR